MTPLERAEPQDELARRLTLALETAPAVVVPQDFAARMAMLAKALPVETPALALRFSKLGIQAAFAILLLAMLVFLPAADSRANVPLTLEIVLALEFVGLTTWLTLRAE